MYITYAEKHINYRYVINENINDVLDYHIW